MRGKDESNRDGMLADIVFEGLTVKSLVVIPVIHYIDCPSVPSRVSEAIFEKIFRALNFLRT